MCEEIGKCSQCKEGYELVGNECQRKGTLSSSEYPSFEEFKEKCRKNYESEQEENKRRAIYEYNLDRLSIYRDEPYSVGVNCHSDRTDAEVVSSTGYRASPTHPTVGSRVQ